MELDTVINADCIKWLSEQPEGFANLVFADPPFNIGYQYDVYEDKLAYKEYYDWTENGWPRASGHSSPPAPSGSPSVTITPPKSACSAESSA